MEDVKFIIAVFLTCLSVVSGEYCTYYENGIWGGTQSMYCSQGCCGDMYNRYCCVYSGTGAIVGIVVGVICGVILLVSVIVAVCCCLRKSRGQAGQVCQPNLATQPAVNIQYGVPNTTVAYGVPAYNNMGFVQTTTMTAGAPMQQHPMQPNPYAQPPPKYEEVSSPQSPPTQPQPN